MPEYVIPVVVAVIALFGTLLGIYFGYRKSSAERHSDRGRRYFDDRQKAYKEVWDRVEQLNIDGRIAEILPEAFTDRLTQLNAFMLKTGIYIDDSDRELINNYIAAAREFHRAVRGSENEQANIALGDTNIMPQEVLDQVEGIRDSLDRAILLRDSLVQRIRAVLTGCDN